MLLHCFPYSPTSGHQREAAPFPGQGPVPPLLCQASEPLWCLLLSPYLISVLTTPSLQLSPQPQSQ